MSDKGTPVSDPYAGFPRGFIAVVFKKGTSVERIDAVLAEIAGKPGVKGANRDNNEMVPEEVRDLLATVQVETESQPDKVWEVVAEHVAAIKSHAEVEHANEVLPQICIFPTFTEFDDTVITDEDKNPPSPGPDNPCLIFPGPDGVPTTGPVEEENEGSDLYAGFARGIIALVFKAGTPVERIDAILAEVSDEGVESSKRDDNEMVREEYKDRLATVRVKTEHLKGKAKQVQKLVDGYVAKLEAYAEIENAREVLPVICWGYSPDNAANNNDEAAVEGNEPVAGVDTPTCKPTEPKDPYAGFTRGIIAVRFKDGTSNERIAAVMADALKQPNVKSAEHKLANEEDDRLRCLATVKVDGKDSVAAVVDWLKATADVESAHEVLPQICGPFGQPRK